MQHNSVVDLEGAVNRDESPKPQSARARKCSESAKKPSNSPPWLGTELSTGQESQRGRCFGLRGFYRGKKIFAALPVTRTIKNPSSFIFRIEPLPAKLLERAKAEPRIDTENAAPSAKWLSSSC